MEKEGFVARKRGTSKKLTKNYLKKAHSALEKLTKFKTYKKLSLSNKFNIKKVQHLLNEQEERNIYIFFLFKVYKIAFSII